MASGVVTASQSDEECTLTGTPPGSATNEEGASGSLGVSWSEEASGSAEVPAPATAATSASSDEADSSDSTSGEPDQVPTPASDQPNRWCVDGQFQVYSDAKFLIDKEVMTRTLTLERRVLRESPNDAADPQPLHQASLRVDSPSVGMIQRGNGPRVLRILRSDSPINDR